MLNRWFVLVCAAVALSLSGALPAQHLGSTLLGPPNHNAYGPGVHSDATGRPFQYQTQQGSTLQGHERVRPNAFAPGLHMDQYGRPVQARPR